MNDEVIEIIENPFKEEPQKLGPVLYKHYKLRRKSDGLYSSGGSWITWSSKGKVWNTLSALSGHLGGLKGEYYDARHSRHAYNLGYDAGQVGTKWDDIEIVCLEIRENEVEKQEAATYIAGLRERQVKRETQQKARKARRELEQAQAQYDRAKKLVDDFQSRYGG
jgi:hypothetical protein